MIMKTLFIAGVLLTVTACKQQPGEPESTVLLKSTTSWDGTPYKAYPDGPPELTMLKIQIPPKTTLNWHKHPIPNAAYVAAGELEVETQDGAKSIRLKQGDTLAELVDIMHRGKTGDNPVELIVFYAGTPGVALSE
ncbi:MAG TPA: cupin domain-containing protein [Pseudomonas sp.]|jgi:quercetin dioxygenase-like cupin family protein